MKSRTLILTLILLSGWLALAKAQSEKVNIAVLDLQPEGLSTSEARILTSRLRIELFRTNKFTVIERERMQEILQEQGLQLSGCTSDQCAVEAGKLLGVQFMITGDVGKIGSLYSVNIRMIDVQTGKIISIASRDCQCSIEQVMTETIKKVAREIGQPIVPEKSPVAVKRNPQKTQSIKNEQNKNSTKHSTKNVRLGPIIMSTALKSIYGYDSDFGYSLGFLFNFRIKEKLFLQPELYYSKYKWMLGRASGTFELVESTMLLQIPIWHGICFNTGPEIAYQLNSSRFKSEISLGLSGGLSYEFPYGFVGMRFSVSGNFSPRIALVLGLLI